MRTGSVHHIEPFIGTDIKVVLPGYYRVDNTAVHAQRAVDILKRRFCHPEQSKPRGCKPEIPLIVIEHVIDRIVKIIGVEPVISCSVNI